MSFDASPSCATLCKPIAVTLAWAACLPLSLPCAVLTEVLCCTSCGPPLIDDHNGDDIPAHLTLGPGIALQSMWVHLLCLPLIACGLGKESLNFLGCCNPFSRAQKAARLSEVEARRSSALGSREAPAVKPAAVVVAGLGGDAGAEPRTGCDVRAAQAQPMV
jgi:hypothetical protein